MISTVAVCAVAECGRPVRSRGWCATHYRRWQRHGDPRAALPVIRPNGAGELSYWSIRRRLRTERGPASAQRCAGCGAAAVCWSYDGTDTSERVDPNRGYRYSLDLTRYRARCRSCHRRTTLRGPLAQPLDAALAARLYAAGASARGIGAVLDASRSAVLSALRAHGVPIRPGGRTRSQHFR